MRRIALVCLIGLAMHAQGAAARAHFLFIRIGEQAEAGRHAEVFFSELAEAGDPRFIDKISGTELSLQTEPGKFQPLTVHKATDRLRAYLPAAGAAAVHGKLEYGILQREVAFLLRYYPKAVAGNESDVNRLQTDPNTPLEIAAEFRGDTVALTLLQNGKPVPRAEFTTVDADLNNEVFQADETGRATWKPGDPGEYSIYAKAVIPQAGEKDGKPYTEIREFATLAFRFPLAKRAADPEAVKLFQTALQARATWAEFPGFEADVKGAVDGRSFDGKATIAAEGDVQLELSEEVAAPWVEDQLGSTVMHRRAPAAGDEPPPVLYFTDRDEHHPLGRLLTFVGGEFASSYRVLGDQITVVNRSFGRQNMTITVLEVEKNAEGKQLPRAYTVQYWDAQTGRLDRTETYRNRWARVGRFDLPVEITATTATSAGLSVRSVTLSNHQLAKGK